MLIRQLAQVSRDLERKRREVQSVTIPEFRVRTADEYANANRIYNLDVDTELVDQKFDGAPLIWNSDSQTIVFGDYLKGCF